MRASLTCDYWRLRFHVQDVCKKMLRRRKNKTVHGKPNYGFSTHLRRAKLTFTERGGFQNVVTCLLMSVCCFRCFPDQNLNLVVELQANSAEDSDDPTELFSKGWTKIDLFDVSNRLLSGRYPSKRSTL